MLCLVFLSGMLLLTKTWAQFPQNPCPSIFQYISSNGVTYGEINIPYDGNKEIDIRVNVSISGLHKDAVSLFVTTLNKKLFMFLI